MVVISLSPACTISNTDLSPEPPGGGSEQHLLHNLSDETLYNSLNIRQNRLLKSLQAEL